MRKKGKKTQHRHVNRGCFTLYTMCSMLFITPLSTCSNEAMKAPEQNIKRAECEKRALFT